MSFHVVYIFQTIKCTHFGQDWGSRLRGTWVFPHPHSFICFPFHFLIAITPKVPLKKKLLLPLSYHSVFSPPLPSCTTCLSLILSCPCTSLLSLSKDGFNNRMLLHNGGHYANASFIPCIKKATFFVRVRTHCIAENAQGIHGTLVYIVHIWILTTSLRMWHFDTTVLFYFCHFSEQ